MTTFSLELALHLPGNSVPGAGVVWSDHPPTSSFRTDLGVTLAEFGDSPEQNRDFLRIAVAVFLADQSKLRPRTWERDLKIKVPVEAPEPWAGPLPDLQRLLGFLTGDRWTIELVHAIVPTAPAGSSTTSVREGDDIEKYMLLSGGADSLSGALTLACRDDTCFVSRVDAGQPAVRNELRRLWGAHPVSLARKVNLRSDRTRGITSREGSSRSRSLLFFALALLPASPKRRPVLVPENGFASLNVPLVPERTGSHSTRTTHPRFIAELQGILATAGAHNDLSNPFVDMTKGEMFQWVAAKWGAPEAGRALSASISCARRTGLRVPKPTGTNHCGICYGCLVRRAAFCAADLNDDTLYYAKPSDPVGHPGPWHTERQREDIRAFQFAVAAASSSEGNADIKAHLAAARLPKTYSYSDAADLVRRGLNEVDAILP